MTEDVREFTKESPPQAQYRFQCQSSAWMNQGKGMPPTGAAAATPSTTTTNHNCDDILLNNFEIKKKRYRVLLNKDHIVWERLNSKRIEPEPTIKTDKKENATNATSKEAELETEQLSVRSSYGVGSRVVHVNEIIRVSKGNTKAASLRVPTPPSADQQQQQQQQPPASVPPTEQYLTIHYAERIENSATDCNRWHVLTLTLYNSDAYIVRQWHASIDQLLRNSARLRVQRMLVFVNPYGGRRQGLQMYERHCKSLFQLAGIDVSCVISQRANQIRDILMSHDLRLYDAVCCVGGDGTVAEVINGLIFRAMRDNDIDMLRPRYIPKPSLPVGIIPAGSTDTVAYTLHGTSDVRTAAIHVVLGQRRGLDVSSVHNRQGIVRFCASVLSYGYLGDVAAKSEKYRWMGTKRYEYTGVKAFLSNRGYEAELRIQVARDDDVDSGVVAPATGTGSDGASTICYADCKRCSSSISEYALRSMDGLESDDAADCDDREPSTSSPIAPEVSKECDGANSEGNCDMRSVRDSETLSDRTAPKAAFSYCSSVSINNGSERGVDVDTRWRTIKGEFFMISGANIACACSRSPNGMARYSHLGDGHLDLILVRRTSIFNNLRFLLNTVQRTGDIRSLPFVEVYRTRKFTFRTQFSPENDDYSIRGSCQPIADAFSDTGETNDRRASRWNCDGEVVNDLDITMSCHCQLIDVFMRGPQEYNPSSLANKNTNSTFCCNTTSSSNE